MATTYVTLTNLQQYDNKLKQYIDNGWYDKATMDELLDEIRRSASGIDKTVDDLVYYYTKSQTYSREEIMDLIHQIEQFEIIVVNELPITDIDLTALYLLRSVSEGENVYTQYVYTLQDGWIDLGKQSIDLSDYYTKEEVDALIPDKVSELENDAGYITSEDMASAMVTGVKGGAERNYKSGNVNITKGDIGLSLVENKSSALIRSELTTSNVVSALGFMPSASDTWLENTVDQAGYVAAGAGNSNKVWATDENGVPAWRESGSGNVTGVKGSAELGYRIGNVSISPSDIGLGLVENKSSATIRNEITSENITNALGSSPILSSEKAVPLGVATLNSNGKVSESQLPDGYGSMSLDNLNDVEINQLATSQVLVYDAQISKWINLNYNIDVGTGGVANKVWKTDGSGVPGWRDDVSGGDVTGVKGAAESSYRIGNVSISKEDIGLGNVENKSSSTIRQEITPTDIQNALGYIPADESHTGTNETYPTVDNFPQQGNSNNTYIAQDTGYTYTWDINAGQGSGTWSLISYLSFDEVFSSVDNTEFSLAVHDNNLHLICGGGGNSSSGSSLKVHYKYDGSNWMKASDLPNGIYFGSSDNLSTLVDYNNELYFVDYNKKIYKLLDETGWEQVAVISDVAISNNVKQAIVCNDKIYITIGTKLYTYDGTDLEQSVNSPNDSYYSSLIVYNDELYTFTSGHLYKLDTETDQWVEYTTIPSEVQNYAEFTCTYNNTVHFISNVLSGNTHYIKHHIWDGINWFEAIDNDTSVPDFPYMNYSGCVYDDQLQIIGLKGDGYSGYQTSYLFYGEGEYIATKSMSSLEDIQDVDISSPSDGQTIRYNGTTQKWENVASSPGASTIQDLTDTNISSLSDKQILVYDNESHKWVNSDRLTTLENTVGEVNAAFNSLFGE